MTEPARPTDAALPPVALVHREGFSRPETTLEKIGYAGSLWLGRAGIAVVLLVVAFGLVVGIPAWSIAGSPSYFEAKKFIYNSEAVHMEIGGEPLGFDRVPTRYRVGPDKAEFIFGVEGNVVPGYATVTVTRASGVWAVTSASFMTDTRKRGVHRPIVLVRGG